MADFLTWYCQLFGYYSCSALSTFEALVLFGIGAVCFFIGVGLVFGVLGAIVEFNKLR